MLNGFGAFIGGIFIGAVGVELVRRRCPDAMDRLYARTREITSEAIEAFKRGYESSEQPGGTAASR